MKKYIRCKFVFVFFVISMANIFAMEDSDTKRSAYERELRRHIDTATGVDSSTLPEARLALSFPAGKDIGQVKQDRMKAIYVSAKMLSEKITERTDSLKEILSDYQTQDVTHYEIERSIRTLNRLDQNACYLGSEGGIDSAAIMLPSNLPLYSLVIFALIPSFMAKRVHVRPNALLQEHNTVTRLYEALDLDKLFPGVNIINTDHAGFKKYVRDANLVVFTGNPVNAENLIKDMRDGSVLVVNGSGHNPVVVTDSADIDKAVEGALLLKGFNGGQDCAGPDAILVHNAVAKKFIEKFNERFSSLKTGSFHDPKTIIGPIGRLNELQKFASIFHKNRKELISGGVIDFRTGIVLPTTIVRNIDRHPNYEEMFGPVAFIHPYNKDEDLSLYFHDSDGRYNKNRMYVTVYGHSDYVSSRDDSLNPGNPDNIGIVLQDKTIHDVEIGYKAYGGYSLGASCVIKKMFNSLQKMAMPILIPQVIDEYLIKGNSLPFKKTIKGVHEALAPVPSTKIDKQIDPVIQDFQTLVVHTFGENLAFGFVFGSAAKGRLKVEGVDKDDLDTFICLKVDDKVAVEKYIKGLALIHQKYNLKVDDIFPAEIMTLKTLRETIDSLGEITVSVDEVVAGDKFDRIFWLHALTDKKAGFTGDAKLMSTFIRDGSPYMAKWRDQIIKQLEGRETIPAYLCKTFMGLSKEEILKRLSNYNPHQVVHLGLSYCDGQTAKKESV